MSDSEKKLDFRQAVAIALITGALTLGGSWIVILGQQHQARDEFKRSQQASAYAEFVSAAEDLYRAERKASLLFADGQEVPTQQAGQDEIDALGDINVRLQTATAMVDIVGPSDAADASRALEKHFTDLSAIYFDGFNKLNPKPSSESLSEIRDKANPMLDGYHPLKTKFLEASRSALEL